MLAHVSEYEEIEGIRLADMSPLPHHILVRWNHKDETKGGVILPQNRQRKNYMRGVVLRQGFCDGRWFEGETVIFDGLCEKQWLGPQSPGDRDTTFFMREEDLIAIVLTKDEGGHGGLKMLNGRVLIKPDMLPEVEGGIVRVNREQKKELLWGKVVYADMGLDIRAGDHVVYEKTPVIEIRLGDFEGEVHHCVPCVAVQGMEILAGHAEGLHVI